MKKITTTLLLLLLTLGVFVPRTYADFDDSVSSVNFTSDNIYSDVWALKSFDNDIPAYTTSMALEFPTSHYHRFEMGGIDSTITFYDDDSDLLREIEFLELKQHTIGELYAFDFEGLGIPGARSFSITLLQSFSTLPTGADYLGYMNENTLTFNDTIKTLIVYDRMSVYVTKSFVRVPPTITPPTYSDLQFNGWRLANGETYNFEPVTDDMLNAEDTLIIYASWTSVIDLEDALPGGDTSPGGPIALANFFGLLGLYNFPGLMFIYLLVIISVAALLSIFKVPGIALTISVIAITGLFMYANYLPTFAYLIILGFALFTFFIQITARNPGGAPHE